MKILHIITGLNNGGAETVLYRLTTANTENTHQIISMMDSGFYGERLIMAGIPVYTLNMPHGRVTIKGIIKLYRLMRSIKPDVVQTWMYHADLLGGVISQLFNSAPVVWGIRNFNLDPEFTSLSTRLVAKLSAILSWRLPTAIICPSKRAMRIHQKYGYCVKKLVLIPNGYDMSLFSPDHANRQRIREEWGIVGKEFLIGMVARWHPLKDYRNLLKALFLLAGKGVSFRVVLVGTGMDISNKALVAQIQDYGLQNSALLIGPHDNIPAVMNGLDLHVLSSVGEAFPNVVAEAMACGTPCVVTNVGDAAFIVGHTGWIVPPSNPQSLSTAITAAMVALAADGKDVLGTRCRTRIVEHFSMERMVNAYMTLWTRVAKKGN
ncbi:MAG: glycosyltransferase [Deltaproteobacteria bacterium]|nr:glycosyltransferase [Deltaproteobacteria bacterium]